MSVSFKYRHNICNQGMQLFLTYIDESGKPSLNDEENEYVLSALTIHESDYKNADEYLSEVKRKYFPNIDPNSLEIHAMNIISGKGQFHDLDVSTRISLFEDVLRIVSKLDCTINCIVFRKNRVKNWSEDDVNYTSFKFLFERLCRTHDELNLKLCTQSKDHPQFGILFMDHIQESVDRKVNERFRRMMSSGTEYVKNKYLIEDLIFVDSQYRSLSQIVDCIAYCVRRYHRLVFRSESNVRELETFRKLYKIVYDRIRGPTNRSKTGMGLKIYP